MELINLILTNLQAYALCYFAISLPFFFLMVKQCIKTNGYIQAQKEVAKEWTDHYKWLVTNEQKLLTHTKHTKIL